jgi:glycosyltransferase involved in cell wall biosynthesis
MISQIDETAAVCLLTSHFPPEVGGVAVSSRRLADYLVEGGYRVHVVTPVTEAEVRGTASPTVEGGATIHRVVADAISTDDLSHFRLRKYLKDLDSEVGISLFHGFFLTVAYPCILAANGRNGRPQRPTILSIRGNDSVTLISNPLLRSMFLFAMHRASWVTSVNQLYLDQIPKDVHLSGRSSVIRNGIGPIGPHDPWAPDSRRRGVVGTVGEFRTVKDIPLLIRAYAGLPASLRRGLVLAGSFCSAEEEVWSRMLIDEFGLGEEVEITGRFEHARVAQYLDRLYVYVQSSAYEGMPNALLEAATCGIPLVATAVGGMKEVLEDRRSALLVPHGDPVALTAAIQRILEDAALALRLSQGARGLAGSLSVDREKEAWLALYRRLLAKERPN